MVALEDGGPRALAERVTVNPRAHGELLTPQMLDVMAEAGHQLADADAIVVGAGPGPFTGLRVGMVTAAALGHACGRRVYPVCSLDAIAAQVDDDAPLLVVTDARRKEVYWAVYDGGAVRTRLTGPNVDRPEDVPAQIAEWDVRVAAGEMAVAHRDVLALDIAEARYPRPVGLVAVAETELHSDADPAPLVPMYLRRPDAEAPGPRKPVSTGTENSRGRP